MLLFAIAQRFKFGCGFTRHLFHQGCPLEAALLPRKLSPSAVGIYPVTDEVTESNWSVQVVSGEGVDPKPQTVLRFTPSTSFVTNTIC